MWTRGEKDGLNVWVERELVHYWHAAYVTSSIISDTAVAAEVYGNKNTHFEKRTDCRINLMEWIYSSVTPPPPPRYPQIPIFKMCLHSQPTQASAQTDASRPIWLMHYTQNTHPCTQMSLPLKYKKTWHTDTHTFLHQAPHHQTASLWEGHVSCANLRGSDDTKHMCEPPTACDWQALWAQPVVTDQNISLAGRGKGSVDREERKHIKWSIQRLIRRYAEVI